MIHLLIILCILLLCLWFYDDLSIIIAEMVLLERGKIVKYTATGAHLRIAIEGRNFDIWVNYDPSLKSRMRSLKIIADGKPLSFLPGCLPQISIEAMGYKNVSIKQTGHSTIKFKEKELIDLKIFAEDKK